MTAADIAEARAALVAAGAALSGGGLSIPDQVKLGQRCYMASYSLRRALEKIDVPVEA